MGWEDLLISYRASSAAEPGGAEEVASEPKGTRTREVLARADARAGVGARSCPSCLLGTGHVKYRCRRFILKIPGLKISFKTKRGFFWGPERGERELGCDPGAYPWLWEGGG